MNQEQENSQEVHKSLLRPMAGALSVLSIEKESG
jgi:hypothetical protein